MTHIAAESAKAIIKPNGAAVTLQNGGERGNTVEVLGHDRVLGGSACVALQSWVRDTSR